MTDLPKPKLLVVDDEPAQLRALCSTLAEEGYAIVGCASGEAALAALEKQSFELLLTDLTMPGMDGIAVVRAALQRDATLVGVIMTGKGTIATAVEAMQSGALDYIVKPFKLSAVLMVIERALSVRRLRVENAALAQRVHERTAELEAANYDLEAYAYSVSHDLRSPLVVIDGLVGLLQRRLDAQLTDETNKLLGHIVDSVQRMHQLIEALMRLSHLGRKALQRRSVDLGELVGSVIAELALQPQGLFGARVQIAGTLPCVDADPGLLRQAIVNLISNGAKFSRNKPEPRVEVGCEPRDGETVFFVRDNGAGFDMAHAEHLFTPFRRMHRSDEYEGMGIGLSIVQRIVARHGGHIWAEAAVGQGATFFFTLGRAAHA
ncbi:response regulator [Piscinibacter sp.]|jgi:two-component system sensor histidine kinase/response regulator|uniref:response regulator n=1 Tax=Piscinibacter sp. TaxID=1903157 RepID=UPI00355AB206